MPECLHLGRDQHGAGWEDGGMDYGVRVLRFAEYPVVPWRNGRGVTREIAAGVVAAGRRAAGS